MGTEVLRPQDCLIHQRIRVAPVVFPRRKTNFYGNGQQSRNNNVNGNGNRKVQQVRPEQQQRRRSPEPVASTSGPKRSASVNDLKASRSNQGAIGQVTILRRGESIDLKESPRTPSPAAGTTDRFGPGPEMVPKQIRMSRPSSSSSDMYAGSAFSNSPSPRAVPLPSFFNNRKSSPIAAAVDDSATKDLRRLLRLE